MPKYLTIIRGLSGAGKTYLANEFIRIPDMNGALISSDDFFDSQRGGYKYSQNLLGMAHDYAFGNAMLLISNIFDRVYVHDILPEKRDIERYVNGVARLNKTLAPEDHITLRVLCCTGKFKSPHGVPRRVNDKLRDRFEPYEGEFMINDPDALVRNAWKAYDTKSLPEFTQKA